MSEKVMNFQLKVSEVNTVLAALAKQPYEAVFGVINAIQEQGKAQIGVQAAEISEE